MKELLIYLHSMKNYKSIVQKYTSNSNFLVNLLTILKKTGPLMKEKLRKIRKKFLKKIGVKWKKFLENLKKFTTYFITIIQTDGKFSWNLILMTDK